MDMKDERVYGPPKCPDCGETTPLPGIHKCKPSYQELKAELAKHEWVSVEDRLPDDETEVLVLSVDEDETIFQMDLCNGRWRDECGQDVRGTPTHWMPIPTLPEQENSK